MSDARTHAVWLADVWFVDLERHCDQLEREEELNPRLPADAAQRAAAMRDAAERRLWRASHIALRWILEAYCGPSLRGVPFVIAPGGRPELADKAVSFSLSHSGGAALIAVSRSGTIGVDIAVSEPRAIPEDRRLRIEALAIEMAGGRPLPSEGARRFLQAWTRLEAIAKVEGDGVLKLLREGGVRGSHQPHGAASKEPRIQVLDLSLGDGYCGAVAGTVLPDAMAVKVFEPSAENAALCPVLQPVTR